MTVQQTVRGIGDHGRALYTLATRGDRQSDRQSQRDGYNLLSFRQKVILGWVGVGWVGEVYTYISYTHRTLKVGCNRCLIRSDGRVSTTIRTAGAPPSPFTPHPLTPYLHPSTFTLYPLPSSLSPSPLPSTLSLLSHLPLTHPHSTHRIVILRPPGRMPFRGDGSQRRITQLQWSTEMLQWFHHRTKGLSQKAVPFVALVEEAQTRWGHLAPQQHHMENKLKSRDAAEKEGRTVAWVMHVLNHID